MSRLRVLILGLCAAACGAPMGGGDAGPPLLPADAGLPCEIADLVVTSCVTCHGVDPAGGATFSLATRSDLAASSAIDPSKSLGEQAVTRMSATVSPMPPAGHLPVPAADVAVFQAWVNADLPVGSCDQPKVRTICTSNASWTVGIRGSDKMFPGYACRSCHLGNNLLGQNPTFASAPQLAFSFVGTLYPSLHEANACNGVAPAGAVVEILDRTGAVALSLTPNAAGNFHSAVGVSIALPYTARVRVGGSQRAMTTPQTEGDCNSCHTEGGLTGAPGRIATP